MSEIRFYHLTRTPLEMTLPGLLEKSLQRGWRVLVQCGSKSQLEFLDERLWTAKPDSFLPHGQAEAESPEQQPVLLATDLNNLNGANVLMLVGGAQSTPEKMAGFELACLFFDGNDPAAVDAARADWKAVSAADLQAVYWAQDNEGHWQQKAKSGG